MQDMNRTASSIGYLEGYELKAMVLRITGRSLVPLEVQNMMNLFDLDKDGRLSENEFTTMTLHLRGEFNTLNSDRSTLLTKASPSQASP